MHEEKVTRWRSLDPTLRGQVKSTVRIRPLTASITLVGDMFYVILQLLSSLAAEEVLARSAAAQVHESFLLNAVDAELGQPSTNHSTAYLPLANTTCLNTTASFGFACYACTCLACVAPGHREDCGH